MQTKRKRDVDVLTQAQVDKLAAKMPAQLRASVVLAAWCGLRWGETSELRRKDVSKELPDATWTTAVTYRRARSTLVSPKTAAGSRYRSVAAHSIGCQGPPEEPRRYRR